MAWLSKKDKRMAALIARMGIIRRETSGEPFPALILCILAQQVSAAAADTVSRRLTEMCGGVITPEALALMGANGVQKCGTSFRKARYIIGIAEAAQSGQVDFGALSSLPDGEVAERLTALTGVGTWTAEMVLIFSLGRPDVMSYGDLAIRRGLERLYGHKELTRAQFERYRKRFSPHGTAASLYLWALAVEG